MITLSIDFHHNICLIGLHFVKLNSFLLRRRVSLPSLPALLLFFPDAAARTEYLSNNNKYLETNGNFEETKI